MSTVERLQALIASGNFSWEKDGETLRDALRIIQSLQAARIAAYEMSMVVDK